MAKYHVRQADFETRELAQDSMWESAAISSQFQLIKTFGLTFVEACKGKDLLDRIFFVFRAEKVPCSSDTS